MKNPNYDYVEEIFVAMLNVHGDDKIKHLQNTMALKNPKYANDETFKCWVADVATNAIGERIPE